MADSEQLIQTHIIAALLKLQDAGRPIEFAGDMNAGKRSRYQQLWAKATGLMEGEADVRIYGPHGRLLLVEVKKAGGKLSAAQTRRHGLLRALNHTVEVLWATTGEEAATKVTTLVQGWLDDIETNRAPAQAEAQAAEADREGAGAHQPGDRHPAPRAQRKAVASRRRAH